MSNTTATQRKNQGSNKKVSSLRKNAFGMELKLIQPKTEAQRTVFETFHQNNLMLHGFAGTGKSYISLFLALREVLEYNRYSNIVLVRSAVQTRDIGFMPGNLEEKTALYEVPYRDIVNDLCERGDAYDILKQRGIIKFMCTSFIRGLTLNNAIVIVDEIQNCTFSELDSVTTRLGDNSKLLLCGDFRQSDLKNQKEKQGLHDFIKVMDMMSGLEHVEFQASDIVRSSFVKQYIINKTEAGL